MRLVMLGLPIDNNVITKEVRLSSTLDPFGSSGLPAPSAARIRRTSGPLVVSCHR
jgi:hypothetical protein